MAGGQPLSIATGGWIHLGGE